MWLGFGNHLGGGFKDFLFSPLPGKMIQVDDQMGLNHQIVALFLKLLRIFEFNYFSSITLNQNQRFPFLFREQ